MRLLISECWVKEGRGDKNEPGPSSTEGAATFSTMDSDQTSRLAEISLRGPLLLAERRINKATQAPLRALTANYRQPCVVKALLGRSLSAIVLPPPTRTHKKAAHSPAALARQWQILLEKNTQRKREKDRETGEIRRWRTQGWGEQN